MARVSISISDELKERMEGLNCNWSALAQLAFKDAVEIEEMKIADEDMEAGLIRLRADKRQHAGRETAEGRMHGTNWALETATYDELHAAVSSSDLGSQPALAVEWVNLQLDNTRFDLPGMPKSAVGEAYALAFLQGVAEVYAKI